MPGFISQERLAYGPWSALERCIARLLQHAGFHGVSLVGGAGDLGADILGNMDGQSWVIQSKFRAAGGVHRFALEEAVRAMSAYSADVVVAATNQYFTEDAYQHCQTLCNAGVEARLWSGNVLLDHYSELPETSLQRKDLRHYQATAVAKVEAARTAGASNALVLMATGLGKTMVASQLIANELDRNPDGEVLVLAHTTDLVRQLEIACWPALKKQISTHLWTDGERPAYPSGVTFATWQSVLPAARKMDMAGKYSFVVVDEAHHAGSVAYRELIELLRPNFLVGVTATPWRGDKLSIAEVFGEPVYAIDIVDGLQQGFLANVDYRMLVDDIDWHEVVRLSRSGYTVSELNGKLLLPDRDQAIIQVLIGHMREIERPRVIGFCRSVEHAERFQRLMLADGVPAGLLHSGQSRAERFRNLSRFRAGESPILLAVDMLNEGIDVPDVNLVAFLRVTHSRRIFIQQLGRGLRLTQGKSTVRVLDFVADIRRIAAGLALNSAARSRGHDVEVVRFHDGRIIKFSGDIPASFFDEYLADISTLENSDDTSNLRFPDWVFPSE